jgi:hypothetical protein
MLVSTVAIVLLAASSTLATPLLEYLWERNNDVYLEESSSQLARREEQNVELPQLPTVRSLISDSLTCKLSDSIVSPRQSV